MDDMTYDGMSQAATTTTNDVSSSTADHHEMRSGLIGFLLHTPRGLAVLIGTSAFLILLMLAMFLILCVKCLRRQRQKNESASVASTVYATSSSFVPQPSSLHRSSSDPGDNNTSGKQGMKAGRMRPHKNIITPDRSIAFVVPTVPMHVQGRSRHSYPPSCMSPSSAPSSSGALLRNAAVIPPMFETQFFPQFHFEETLGPQIGFSLSYDCALQSLQVRILGGCNFLEIPGLSYGIHVKLYPGRGSKQKTREYEGPNPVYNQEVHFHVRGCVLQTKVLKFRVIGSTPGVIGTKSLLGVVNLAMKDIPIVNHTEVTSDFRTGQMWVELDHPLNVGEGIRLDVSLKWSTDPTPGLLVLKIREAHGLHEITEGDYTTTYVKVTLQEQGKSIKSRKTRLIRWGSLPDYDDTFVVTVPFELLSQVSFLLTLFARGRLGSKTILGKIHIGPIPDSHQLSPLGRSGSTSGNEIWQDMIHQPNVEINRWLQLQP